ncbi:MAG: ABC transporter substrate-binding protein, partial [Thermomicrobiales bacterium]
MEKRNVELRASFFEALLNDRHLDRRSLMKMAAAAGIAAPAASFLVGGVSAQSTPDAESTQKGGDGTLIVSTSGDPLSFNPDFQIDDNGFAPASNIYNKVVTLDHSYSLLPDLAQTWETSEDGLTITFHLVEGATWHDGTPFTSKDVKYTIDMIVATTSATASGLLSAIETVDAPDDATVIFNLKQPSASLLPFLGWYGTFVLPAHIYEGTDWATNPANQSPIGTGPYKFNSYEAGTRIELDANLEYWGEGPFSDKLVFSIIPDANTALQAFLNGETDVMLNSPPLSEVPSVEATEGVKVTALSLPSYYYFGFNVTGQYTSDPEVRKAISQSIDREQIVKTALGGYG